MNFDLTEDQEMLKAVAERFVVDRYRGDDHRGYRAQRDGFSPENWALLGDIGVIGGLYDERSGGLGLDAIGLSTIFEALGRGLVVEPLIESALLAGGLLERLAGPALRSFWMDDLVSGRRRLAFAHREVGARRNPLWVETRGVPQGDNMLLIGGKSLVPAGAGADAYLVTARRSGSFCVRDGVEVFLVQAGTPGLLVRPWRMVDGSMAVSLAFDNVIVPTDMCLGGSFDDLDAMQTRASLARSAEALGIMERMFADTLDYLRTRNQFGVPLGSFQAIRHRMVALYATIEQARALLSLAIRTDAGDAGARDRAILGARAYISDTSVALGHEMIQFHGGMGVTDELVIGHGHKRLLALSRWPDDPAGALDAYADAWSVSEIAA